jgi:hypothetical protein
MAVYGYTKNYKLIKPQFDSDTWHDYEYDNLDVLDAILGSILKVYNFQGIWKNNTKYDADSYVVIQQDSTLYTVKVTHTTDATSTFAEFYALHPDYYQSWDGIAMAQQWATKIDGPVISGETNPDYSAKAYAIGGEGTETNNAKYYAELAGTKSVDSQEQATAAAASAAAALVSEQAAATSKANADGSAMAAEASAEAAAQSETNAATSASNAEALVTTFDSHVTDKTTSFDSHVETKTAEFDENASAKVSAFNQNASEKQALIDASLANIDQSEANAQTYASNAQTWSEGSDAEVGALGGVHSAKGWAELAQSFSNINNASETIAGIAKIATSEEASAGTDDTKIMTPLKVSQVVADNVGKGQQLGFNGTLSGGVLTFVPDQSTYSLKSGYDYEIDLLFSAAGTLPDNTQMVISNGDDTIQILNVKHADASTPMTYGDMKQICRYDANIGWRWVFMARYSITDTNVKVLVMPSTVVNIQSVDNMMTTDTVQTIPVSKVFTAEQQRKSTSIDITTTAESYTANNAFGFLDVNGKDMGHLENSISTDGIHTSVMAKNSDSYQATVGVVVPQSGTTGAYGIAPSTPDTAPNNAIITKDYLESHASGANTDLSNLSETGQAELGKGRRNIGDIFYTARTDTNLAGAVECNGGQYTSANFTGTDSVPALLAAGKLPYISITEFNQCVATNGSCRCFGWDGADATFFKVPKLNDVYIEAGTAANAGEFISETLPNHQHYVFVTDGTTSSDGASNLTADTFASKYTNTGGYGSAVIGAVTSPTGWAGQSSGVFTGNVYQNAAKVRPDSVRYRAMVQIANGASDEALATCTQVLNNLSSKMDASAIVIATELPQTIIPDVLYFVTE